MYPRQFRIKVGWTHPDLLSVHPRNMKEGAVQEPKSVLWKPGEDRCQPDCGPTVLTFVDHLLERSPPSPVDIPEALISIIQAGHRVVPIKRRSSVRSILRCSSSKSD